MKRNRKKPKTVKQIARFVRKKTGAAQKQIDIARERGISMKEILCYDHSDECMLFDEDLVAKPAKSELITELEKHLEKRDYIFMLDNEIKTAIIVDFMSQIQKYPTTKLFNEFQ